MKRIFTLFAIVITAFANAQVCNPDNSNAEGIRPPSENVPCAIQGTFFSQTYTIVLPATVLGGAPVSSVSIDSVTNLPTGLTVSYQDNPPVYSGGEKVCFLVSGTPIATCGQYKIKVYVRITAPGLTTPSTDITTLLGPPYDAPFIRVTGAGDACPNVNTSQTTNFASYLTCGSVFPILSSDAASAVTSSSAQFNGTVNAKGFTCTPVFEWGTTTNYEEQDRPATPATVSGNNPTTVSSAVFGLNNNTTYHYRLKVTYSNSVLYSDDRSFTTGNTTGVNEANSLDVKVYPNPAKNELNVETSSNEAGALVLSNLLGANVFSVPSTAATTKLDVSNMPAGVYTLTFITAGKTSTTRVSIEK